MPTQKSQTRANATPSPAIVKAITTLYVVNQAASVLPWLVGAAVGGRCIVSVLVAFCARCARVLSAISGCPPCSVLPPPYPTATARTGTRSRTSGGVVATAERVPVGTLVGLARLRSDE